MKKSLTIIFICALFLPILQMSSNIFPQQGNSEKRVLAQMPKIETFNIGTLKSYLDEYQQYFTENFGFRNTIIKMQSLLLYVVFKQSSVDKVVIGNNGWLYFDLKGQDVVEVNMADYMGEVNFNTEQLNRIKENFELIRREMERRNIKFYFLLTPNKQTIYPEQLPFKISSRTSSNTRRNQIDHILSNLDLYYINPTDEILDEKRKKLLPLYYLTDTHWNEAGAFIGYQKLIKRLHYDYPQIPEITKSDFNTSVTSDTEGGDLALMLNINGYVNDIKITNAINRENYVSTKVSASPGVVSYESNAMNNLKLLVFHDSFAISLMKYLTIGFSKSQWVWQQNIDFTIIDKEKPDIVIWEIVERYSTVLLNKPKIERDNVSSFQ